MNWTMVLLLGIAVMQMAQALIILGLLRQVGLLNLRINPAGARTLPIGPTLGQLVPPLELPDLEESSAILELPPSDGRAWIVTFISPACSSCRFVAPGVKALAAETRREIGWAVVAFGNPSECLHFRREHGMRGLLFCHASNEVRDSLQIGTTPYSLAVGSDGVLHAKGLVNHIEHLESLVNVIRLSKNATDPARSSVTTVN